MCVCVESIWIMRFVYNQFHSESLKGEVDWFYGTIILHVLQSMKNLRI